jgi:hypothetical protein
MRKAIIAGAVLLVFAAIMAAICLLRVKPRAGPWRLADGSELSLAGVTYGTNHAMRYGNGIADYLYPILSPALRKKLGCKVATVMSFTTNSIVIWVWQKGVKPLNGTLFFPPMSGYNVTVVDENGIESAWPSFPSTRVLRHKTDMLQGVQLFTYPWRSQEIGIRIRRAGDSKLLGEFKIPNRTGTNYPVWTAHPLPVNVKTNDLEVSLVTFETGLSEKGIKSGTRAVFKITEKQEACDDWIMQKASICAAAGACYDPPLLSVSTYGSGGEAVVSGRLPLWSEEPAWKLTAEFWRTTNYPAAELWVVKAVPILAGAGITQQVNRTTNIYDTEIELLAITGGKLTTNFTQTKPIRGPAVLHVTSPIPSSDKHLRLAAVVDDRGRKVDFHLDGETPSTGGRGATVRQLDKDYYLYLEEDAKSVDVTLAYTKSVFVEFMAQPTVARENEKK